jgi:hypothetical protein
MQRLRVVQEIMTLKSVDFYYGTHVVDGATFACVVALSRELIVFFDEPLDELPPRAHTTAAWDIFNLLWHSTHLGDPDSLLSWLLGTRNLQCLVPSDRLCAIRSRQASRMSRRCDQIPILP